MSSDAVEIRDLRKSFGPTEIIRGLNLSVTKGERHAIIGPNGAGKSTLFHLISGRIQPTSGAFSIHGQDVTGWRPYQIARHGLSRSFQISNIFARLTVEQNVRCALLRTSGHGYAPWRRADGIAKVEKEIDRLLEDTHLSARREVEAQSLTYAEQRALEIALTVATGATTILLDEPTAGMSHAETEYMVGLIRRVSAGRTLMMVEHDMGVVFGLADRISVLVYGQIIATDVPDRIRENAAVQEAYLGTAAEQQQEPAHA